MTIPSSDMCGLPPSAAAAPVRSRASPAGGSIPRRGSRAESSSPIGMTRDGADAVQ